MMTNAISRGELWMTLLAPNVKRVEGLCPSVQAADGELNGEAVRFVAVVPDAHNHFPRAAKRGSRSAGGLDAGESGERNRGRGCQ